MNKKILFAFTLLLSGGLLIQAQQTGKKAILNEDGTISVESVILPVELSNRPLNNFEVLWTWEQIANPTFKNMRGVTLADLDNDGVDEILYGVNNKLYALKGDGTVLWEKQVSGTITLPPTAYDLDGNGTIEIVLNTGGSPAAGRVYLMDAQGNDLPGWPLNFENHWMINAPSVADVDGDGIMEIFTGERITATLGKVHALKLDGTPLNANWPVEVNATPAFTPSIGDVNGDGEMNVVMAASKGSMYVFDLQGQPIDGFPVTPEGVSYSYQSPILADLDGDGFLSIIGSNHGDNAGFYVMNHDGTYRDGWPRPLSGWTYSPPTVIDWDNDGQWDIFMSDRRTDNDGNPLPVIFGMSPDGGNLPNFPIEVYGGTEGVLTIADINNDGILDIIFPSVMTDADGYGYIHAFSLDGSGEIEGFPIRPLGFTFMNGAVLGDVNNDGLLDLVVNSYTTTYGAGVDMTYINVYNLNVPYVPENIKRNGYKGNNTRNGLVLPESTTGINEVVKTMNFNIAPNPSDGFLNLNFGTISPNVEINVFGIDGKLIHSKTLKHKASASLDLSHLDSGIYFIKASSGNQVVTKKWIRK